MSTKTTNSEKKSPDRVTTPLGPRPRSTVHHVKANREIVGERIMDPIKKEFIITPGGPKRKALVHHIEKGHFLENSDGRMIKKDSDGRLLREYGEISKGIANKALLPRDTLKRMAQVPGKSGGWITFSQFRNNTGQPITQFQTQWVVPREPLTKSDQLIYLFNGLQNATKILQPVLQWGDNGDSGGDHWQVASWYAGNTFSDSFRSDYVRVNPGDLLTGVMTLIGNSAGGFDYNCIFLGIPDTSLTVRNQPELTMCVETLEAYDLDVPDEYPGSDFTAFYNINIQTLSPLGGNTNPPINWQPVVQPLAQWGESTRIINNANAGGEVDIFYTNSPASEFSPVYMQGAPGLGIGGYDLLSQDDRCFAFDFDGSGFADYITLFRPGTGAIFVIRNNGRGQLPALPTPPLTFSAVYATGGNGIDGYDLQSDRDKAFAFDYNSNGQLDHMVLYRPGAGVIFILKNNAGNFQPVFQSFNGIAGYDLLSKEDRVFAFDYDGNGLADHLVLYRPGAGVLFILKNNAGGFQPVFQSFNGIGGYDLLSKDDKVFAFDYDGSGSADHLVFYRPGAGVLFILKNNAGAFQPVFQSFGGIGGYDLLDKDDKAFAFDFNSSGNSDHLAIYRPGTGTMWILRNNLAGGFTPVYQQGAPGHGIGGYDLLEKDDKVFAFDYDRSGKEDHMCCYRPGTGTFWIIKKA